MGKFFVVLGGCAADNERPTTLPDVLEEWHTHTRYIISEPISIYPKQMVLYGGWVGTSQCLFR